MRKGIVVGLLLACAVAAGWAGSPKSDFSFRIHVEVTRGEAPGQLVPVLLNDPVEEIQISRYASLSEKHVAGVERLPDGKVMVLLSDEGRQLLEVTTSNNSGKIMVVLVNGRVLYAPLIDTVLRNGRMLLPAGVSDDEFAAWQRYLKQR